MIIMLKMIKGWAIFTFIASSKAMPWLVSQIDNGNINSTQHLLTVKPYPCKSYEVRTIILLSPFPEERTEVERG